MVRSPSCAGMAAEKSSVAFPQSDRLLVPCAGGRMDHQVHSGICVLVKISRRDPGKTLSGTRLPIGNRLRSLREFESAASRGRPLYKTLAMSESVQSFETAVHLVSASLGSARRHGAATAH